MAAVVTHRAASHGPRAGSRLPRLLEALRAWNGSRLTRKALSRLSDRELADIGLSRADIPTL